MASNKKITKLAPDYYLSSTPIFILNIRPLNCYMLFSELMACVIPRGQFNIRFTDIIIEVIHWLFGANEEAPLTWC